MRFDIGTCPCSQTKNHLLVHLEVSATVRGGDNVLVVIPWCTNCDRKLPCQNIKATPTQTKTAEAERLRVQSDNVPPSETDE